jgi:ketosteroid isomerase-like protein
MGYAEGKAAVRKKGEGFVSKIEEFHGAHTTEPVIGGTGGNYFAVGRSMDITAKGFGRIKMEEIMLYEVRDGQIVSEQFFY